MIKKYAVISLTCFIFLVLFSPSAYAHKGQDHEKLIDAMRYANVFIGQTTNALQDRDYLKTAEKLMELAKVFKSLEKISPQKGTKKMWDTIHTDSINAAFKAIGACADEDEALVRTYIRQITDLMKEGHGIFR